MKFWVKAVVDELVQEQLLVTATSTEELRTELTTLLNIPISSLSIHDFQTQVVDRIASGEDIITVRIKQHASASHNASTSELLCASHTPDGRGGAPACAASSRTSPSAGLFNSSNLSPRALSTRGGGGATPLRTFSHPQGVVVPPTSSEPLRHPEWAESSDRVNSSLGSGQLTMRSGGLPGSVDTSPQEMDSLVIPSTSPSKPPSLLGFPPVEKLWVSREDMELLLARQFRGKYKSVLTGCFVRTRDRHGYGFFQIASIGKGPRGMIVLDTVHGSESITLDTVSNAAPSSDEVRKWTKKMLNLSRPFPTAGFVEAKLGDVESAVSTARSILAASPPSPAVQPANNAVSPPSEALQAEHQPPPSPVLSDSGETPIFSSRPRRPTMMSALSRAAVSCGRFCLQTNDALEFTSVGLCDGCDTDADPPSTSSGRSFHDPGSFSVAGSPHLHLYGTRHSNTTARHPRPADFAGFEMVLEVDASARQQRQELTVDAPVAAAEQPPQPPTHPPTSLLPRTLLVHDRDTSEKGFALFGAPVKWQGRYYCLGQRRPARDTTSASAHVQREDADGERENVSHGEEVEEEEEEMYASLSAASRNDGSQVNDSGGLAQDFVLFTGANRRFLQMTATATSLPIPRWAVGEGREVVVLCPRLVEHLGALHCFYLVRLDNSASTNTCSQSSSPVKRRRNVRHHHHHHHRSTSLQLSTTTSRPVAGRRSARTPDLTTTPPLSDIHHRPIAPEDDTARAVADPSLPPHSELADEEDGSETSAGTAVEQAVHTPPSPLPPFSFGLVHAVASVDPKDADVFLEIESPACAFTDGGLGHPPRLRWRLVNTTGPLVESSGDREPLFAVVSSPPEDGSVTSTLTRVNSRGLQRSSIDVSPPEYPAPLGRHHELNLLWHNRDVAAPSPGLPRATPDSNNGSTPQRSLPVTSFFGGRTSFRLCASRSAQRGSGGSQLLSPAVSRRRSPAVASLQPGHSLGGRVEVPFQRMTNADAAASAAAWVEDAYFAAVEVDVDKLRENVSSLSLFAKDERMYLTTVSDADGCLFVWTLPVTGEP